MKRKFPVFLTVFFLACALAAFLLTRVYWENRMLKLVIERLSADSRAAEALVTQVKTEAQTGKTLTTIKFLEYDAADQPLAARYFTFSENIIQFQAMVIRFDDLYIRSGHPLKGKSAYLFTKVFALNKNGAEIYELTPEQGVPAGYRVPGVRESFQRLLWRKFWAYALDPRQSKSVGIKNAQIEAPGTRFVPGLLYTIRIEHDGGLRIDSENIAPILKGERILP